MLCDCITAADKRILVAGPNGLIGAKVVETNMAFLTSVVSFGAPANLPVLERARPIRCRKEC